MVLKSLQHTGNLTQMTTTCSPWFNVLIIIKWLNPSRPEKLCHQDISTLDNIEQKSTSGFSGPCETVQLSRTGICYRHKMLSSLCYVDVTFTHFEAAKNKVVPSDNITSWQVDPPPSVALRDTPCIDFFLFPKSSWIIIVLQTIDLRLEL